MNVVVITHLSLDGVMQGPGRADEDIRGGFEHGGWSPAYGDAVMAEAMGARLARSGGLILGRRTYEDVLGYWNTQPDSSFTQALNKSSKYIASTTLDGPLRWPNSTLLNGDIADSVSELKARPGNDLHILGSGALVQSLMRHDLIDEYMLTIHPLILGTGRRLFADSVPFTSVQLIDSTTTTTGVIIATYRPCRRVSA